MAFQVSPGVQVREIDATNVIPAVSTSIGGFVGEFNWGPVETVTTIGSENELASVFGTPSTANSQYFLTAAAFLKYGNNLQTVRVVDDTESPVGARNASVGATEPLIYSKDHPSKGYDIQTPSSWGEWVARYPGALGNAIEVHVCTADNDAPSTQFANWEDQTKGIDYAANFDAAPMTSDYALGLGKPATFGDEIHVLIVDGTGAITGTPNTVLEVFPFLSIAADAKSPQGSSIYYRNVINNESQYVYWGDHPTTWEGGDATQLNAGDSIKGSASTVIETAMAENAGDSPEVGVLAYTLDGGLDGTIAQGDLMRGYDLMADSETLDVSLMFSYPHEDNVTSAVLANYLIGICEGRKDCMAFVSPHVDASVSANGGAAAVKTWADELNSSSYGSCDSGAVYVYDKYNDEYRWIGAAGHVAGLCAGTDNTNDAWWSPAGYTRGQLFGVAKLAYNPTQAERDNLYKARVNPLVSFPGQGTLLYGDKTLLSKPSAFDRINVRRLFIVLEKAIATAAKYQLFEFNDEFTQAMFRNMVEPFLRDVQGRRGVTDFLVVCDETNNTGQIVDSNQFVADIYIKPARSINFITLNFIATRTGVDFSEIAG